MYVLFKDKTNNNNKKKKTSKNVCLSTQTVGELFIQGYMNVSVVGNLKENVMEWINIRIN